MFLIREIAVYEENGIYRIRCLKMKKFSIQLVGILETNSNEVFFIIEDSLLVDELLF